MDKADEELLERYGWAVDCYSPLELSHEETNSVATGYGALLVLETLKQREDDET